MSLYKMAGLCVSMTPRYELMASRAKPYLAADGMPDFEIACGGDENEEYAELARAFYEKLLFFDGFLLHASAVELEGKAVAFSAPSGTGKSTHASFWRTQLGATVINDDKPAIRLMDEVLYACGTPFSGKTSQSRNVCVPLAAVVFLKRAETVSVRRLSSQEALFALLGQTLRPADATAYDRLLSLLERLLMQIPVYEAGVPNAPDAALKVKDAIIL